MLSNAMIGESRLVRWLATALLVASLLHATCFQALDRGLVSVAINTIIGTMIVVGLRLIWLPSRPTLEELKIHSDILDTQTLESDQRNRLHEHWGLVILLVFSISCLTILGIGRTASTQDATVGVTLQRIPESKSTNPEPTPDAVCPKSAGSQ